MRNIIILCFCIMMSITCAAQNWSSVAGKKTKPTAAPAKPKVQNNAAAPKKSTAAPKRATAARTRNAHESNVQNEKFNAPVGPIKSEEEKEEEDTNIYVVADKMPSFPGGNQGLMQFLTSNFKYPVEAENKGIQGRVLCSFVVEKDGSISDTRIIQSVHPLLDQEALRIVKIMPKWIPAEKDGKAVRTKFTFPVTFRLQ